MTIDKLLKEVKHIHFIGIGGAGMCPLAEILHHDGYRITGSDNNESDTLNRIRALNIPVVLGHKAENIADAQMVIYTAALLSDNPELVAAQERGIPCFERAVLLGAISRRYRNCIGICGTHGKTTTTSMTVQILMKAGVDPSALIGGKLPLIDANGRVGQSDFFVCEACEFKDHFLEISPKCCVILNVDEDHMEYFKTLENLKRSFAKFAEQSETVIYNGDDINTRDVIAATAGKNLISFGIAAENDWYAENITEVRGAFSEFDVMHRGEFFTHVRLSVPGDHNIYNALAAIAASVYAGVDAQSCVNGLQTFQGAGRRFEVLYDHVGVTVVDDYAHHPKEIAVTLGAAMAIGFERVWAVFQPFTYSRTYKLMDDFAKVLSKADRCVITDIMGSRERNEWGVTAKQLADKIPGAELIEKFDDAAEFLYRNVRPGDLVLTLGCGDVYKIAKKLIQKYEDA